MVDSMLEYGETTLKAGLTVTENEIFAENGELAASGLLEHQAQCVALHTGYRYFLKDEEPPVGYIGAIKYFEVEELPKLGDQIISSINILNEMMDVTQVEVITELNGRIIAKSEMKTVLK